jgi:hypothetical protein
MRTHKPQIEAQIAAFKARAAKPHQDP